ncbi:MAG: hypothetical protein ACE5ID_10190 [Acidobacteriota bacterium]
MEEDLVIKTGARQVDEVPDMTWGHVREEFQREGANIRFDSRLVLRIGGEGRDDPQPHRVGSEMWIDHRKHIISGHGQRRQQFSRINLKGRAVSWSHCGSRLRNNRPGYRLYPAGSTIQKFQGPTACDAVSHQNRPVRRIEKGYGQGDWLAGLVESMGFGEGDHS